MWRIGGNPDRQLGASPNWPPAYRGLRPGGNTGPGEIEKKFHPSTICRSYPGEIRCAVAIANFTGHRGAGWVKMMGELVLNEVEGKEFLTI